MSADLLLRMGCYVLKDAQLIHHDRRMGQTEAVGGYVADSIPWEQSDRIAADRNFSGVWNLWLAALPTSSRQTGFHL